MNLPNQLTVLRLVLTFLFVGFLSFPGWILAASASLVVFIVAAFTDFLDGYLARRHDLITNFGKLMDPLADKVLMAAGFVMLCSLSLIPAWVVVVILAREFLVTGLRLVASAEGVVLAAEGLGKYKTTFQLVTVIYFLAYLASREPPFSFLAPVFTWPVIQTSHLGGILIWTSLILTLLSGVSYAWKNRQLLRDC